MTKSPSVFHAVITAGPTYEPLDQVRRLTNFSTGSLGVQLAEYLVSKGVKVTLLTGYYVTYEGPFLADERQIFTTTADLFGKLKTLGQKKVDAVFHAAAVSDFSIKGIYHQTSSGDWSVVSSGKVSTREGELIAKLVPTPKILTHLRQWFPQAWLAGWKYEVDGTQSELRQKVGQQLTTCRTNACVLNGPALGDGFELFLKDEADPKAAPDRASLFDLLFQDAFMHED